MKQTEKNVSKIIHLLNTKKTIAPEELQQNLPKFLLMQ